MIREKSSIAVYFFLKKIFFLKDGTLIKKGFGKYLSLNFEEDVLIHWLKNGLGNIKKIRNGNMNPDDVLSSIWQSFNSVVTDAINNNKLHIFFSAQTVMGTKAIAYFSKTPSNYGGLPIGTRTFLHPYPIKTLEFQNKYNRDSFYKNVAGDLDVSSYWTFFFNKFCKNFIYTLNQDLEKNKPVYINNPYVLFQQSGIDFFNFYKKNKSILNIFCNLTEKGFYLFLKDRNKKSFAKSKMAQTKLAEIYANKSIPYAEHMFKNYTQGMVEGVTIAANLQDCWKNNICCLDFDNFEKLFSKVNFDESSNLKRIFYI